MTYTAVATGGATGFTASGCGSIDDADVDMPAGSTITYTVTATIVSPAATGTLTNTATVTPAAGSDRYQSRQQQRHRYRHAHAGGRSGDHQDRQRRRIERHRRRPAPRCPARRSLTRSWSPTPGPSDATGASVVDTLPGTLSGVTYTAVATGGATGFTASGTGSIDDTDVDMPAGSTITYTVTATTISPAATGTLSNTATVTAVAGVTDTNPANNAPPTPTRSRRRPIWRSPRPTTSADRASPARPAPRCRARRITYTIVVTNAGPSDAPAPRSSTRFPARSAERRTRPWPTGGATGFTASGSGSIDDADVDMPAGSTITYTVTGTTVNPAATGTLTNTATVTAAAGVTDTNPGNTSATDTDTLAPEADLEITKTDNVGGSSVTGATGTAVPGKGITYTIVVTNAGPSDAPGTSIVDTLPGTLSGVTYTAVPTGGATGFTATGSGNIDDADVDMPAGSTVTYTVTATINPAATGTLTNKAMVTAAAGVTDTNPATSATGTDTLTPQADLEITKTDNVGGSSITGATGTAVPGKGITYTIVVTNAGPSDAPGTSIVDTLPGTLSGVTYTAVAKGGATGFTASGSGSIDDADVDMPAGSTVTYTVTATTINPAATGTLTNKATVTAAAGVTDTNPANTVTDSDNLTPQADLEITKSDNLGGSSSNGVIGTLVPGKGITYTIMVTNAGPSDAPGTSIVDTLPATLNGVTYTAVGQAVPPVSPPAVRGTSTTPTWTCRWAARSLTPSRSPPSTRPLPARYRTRPK